MPVPTWLQAVKEAFDTHPEADCIGGRVKPRWSAPPPDWFTNHEHAGPLALQDRPRAAYVNAGQASACLLTANLGIRRSVFEIVGGFSPHYPRGQDRELEMRMWRAGLQGLYLPTMDVIVEVPPERLTRRYHRRWHTTTARYHALMRYRDAVDANGVLREESPAARRLLGVPLFMYRACFAHVTGWLRAAVRRRSSESFYHETRLWDCTRASSSPAAAIRRGCVYLAPLCACTSRRRRPLVRPHRRLRFTRRRTTGSREPRKLISATRNS